MMSDQPEHDQATPDQGNPAADTAGLPQFPEAPLIRTSIRPAAGRKGRGAAARRKTGPVFDATALHPLVDTPSADADSSEAAARIALPGASPDQTEKPIAEQASRAREAAASVHEAVGGPLDVTTPVAEDLSSGLDLPAVTAGDGLRVRRKTQNATRRGGNSRPAKRRPSRSRASGWILFGVCGATALLVVALLVNKLNGPAGSGAATPRGRSRAENAADVAPLPEFKPGEPSRTGADPTKIELGASSPDGVRPKKVRPDDISRTGVRPMDAEEFTRRRGGIDSFAEMGRAETEKLHREEPKTGSPEEPETP